MAGTPKGLLTRAKMSLTKLYAPNSVRRSILTYLAGEGELRIQDMHWVNRMSLFETPVSVRKHKRNKRRHARTYRLKKKKRYLKVLRDVKKAQRYAARVPTL